jgi:hypothetical protein
MARLASRVLKHRIRFESRTRSQALKDLTSQNLELRMADCMLQQFEIVKDWDQTGCDVPSDDDSEGINIHFINLPLTNGCSDSAPNHCRFHFEVRRCIYIRKVG